MNGEENDRLSTPNLGRIKVIRKHGTEQFLSCQEGLCVELREFWAWSASDLISNATRGVFAEFLVAKALGISTDGVREEWASHDLATEDGLRIEVKSSAYIQSWSQAKHSSISFSIAPSRAVIGESGAYGSESARQADIYVFAVLAHKDQETIEPLDVSQWHFHVVPTSALNKLHGQKTISLSQVDKLSGGSVTFTNLKAKVEKLQPGATE
ncbi:MAG TPA: hypothetical protein VGL56_08925 [Fimbriimonadaceae bacterium]|jgi:hypothetical protein